MSKGYRSNKYGGLYSESFNTPVGRLFWLHLVAPKQFRGAVEAGKEPPKPKYEATICFPKGDPKTKVLFEALTKEVAQMVAAFNVGKKTKLGEVQIFQDGDENQELYTKYPWLKDCYFLTARSGFVCPAVNKKGEEHPVKDILGGMKGKVAFQCCVSNGGLSFTLEGVQFIEDDGVRFGGGARSTAQLFDACEDESTVEEAVKAVEAAAENPEAPAATTQTSKGQKGKAALVNML